MCKGIACSNVSGTYFLFIVSRRSGGIKLTLGLVSVTLMGFRSLTRTVACEMFLHNYEELFEAILLVLNETIFYLI